MSSSRGDKRKQPTMLVCAGSGCEYPDLSTSPYVQLKSDTSSPTPMDSCHHLMCLMCFGNAVSTRSANLRLLCPCETCTFTSRSWDNYVFNGVSHSHLPPREQKVALPLTDNFKTQSPTLFFSNHGREWRRDRALLTVSVPSDDNTQSNTYSALLHKDESNNREEDLKALGDIGRSLHPFLVSPNRAATSHMAYANPSAATIPQLERDDLSPRRHLCHSIGTGELFVSPEKRSGVLTSIMFQKQYNASFVTSESMNTIQGGGHRSSLLKNIISDKLLSSNVRESVIKFFSNPRLKRGSRFSFTNRHRT